MEQVVNEGKLGLGRIISLGWGEYVRCFMSILPVILIVYIPINIGLSFVPVDSMIEQYGLRGFRMYMKIIQLSEFLIGVLATMAIARMVEAGFLGRPCSWREAFRHALSRWGAAIGTGLLGGLIIVGMFLLLIVPGIIWSLYYTFFVIVVALRGLSGKAALDYSKSLVKGQWWRVFGYMLVINLLAFLAGAVVAVPFLFMPETRVINIVSDTLTDIVSALFLVMTTVFFLNNDAMKVRNEPPSLPCAPEEPAPAVPQA